MRWQIDNFDFDRCRNDISYYARKCIDDYFNKSDINKKYINDFYKNICINEFEEHKDEFLTDKDFEI